MYGFGSSEIDLSTCYKGRPEKVLIEDPFSSIIKTNPQELLRPSSVLIEDQKKDKKGCVLLSQFSIVQAELKCLLVETYS